MLEGVGGCGVDSGDVDEEFEGGGVRVVVGSSLRAKAAMESRIL